MDPLTMMLIGAGTGLLKSEIIDKPKEKKARQLAAATQRLSPWTGLKANAIKEADPFGSAMKYGLTGASVGQQLEMDKSLADILKANAVSEQTQATQGAGMMNPWNFQLAYTPY